MGHNQLKAFLKLIFASGSMAGAVALVLAVQNVATYSSLAPLIQKSASASKPSAYVPQTRIYGIAVDSGLGQATMTLTPFTSQGVASAFGGQYGMQLLQFSPAFGRYVFSLPQIRVGPGPEPHTATVFFPPYATSADISSFLARNGLTVQSWSSTSDVSGRTAIADLPQIKPVLIDAKNGVWQAMVAPNIDRTRIDAWATTNGVQVISYEPATGRLLIQGPKPKPVYVPTIVRKPVAKATTSVTTNNTTGQTSKLYVVFAAGTTFTQAQQAIQQAGGQVASFDSTTEVAAATVPVGNASQVTSTLVALPVVSCVSPTSGACPGVGAPAPSTATSTTDTTTTPSPPSSTTGTGTGWTTTVAPAPATTPAPGQLSAIAVDGHVALSWTAVTNAVNYQIFRATGADVPILVATTTATSLTDVGGATGTAYSYSVVPVLSSGPDSTQAQTATATWIAATSTPVIVSDGSQQQNTLSGSVALSADVRTGDGTATATWSIVASNGTTTPVSTAAGTALTPDPLTLTARTVWDSRGVADGVYTLVVTIADGSGHSTQMASQVRVGNAAPAAPTALGAAPVGTSVVLTWRQPAVANGAAYLVQKDTDVEPIAAVATGSLSWTDENAGQGAHTYTVVLEDQFGHKSLPVKTSATVSGGAAPVSLPSLTVTLPNGDALATDGAVDDRLILLSDARAGSSVQFQFEVDGGSWSTVQGTTSCSPGCAVDWNVAGLARGHYSVRALTSAGSSIVRGFTLRGDAGLPAPAAPYALITPQGVSLSWSAANGELSNHFAISRLDGNSWVVLDRVTGTSYLDRSAQPGANQYRIQAYNTDGAVGQASAATTVVVPNVSRSSSTSGSGTIAAPAGLHAVAAPGAVSLMWTSVPDAAGYVIERAWQAAGPFSQVGTTGELVYRDSAPVGAVAYYRVHAFSGELNGAASDVVAAAFVPAAAPASGGVASPFVVASAPAGSGSSQSPGSLTLGPAASSGSSGSRLALSASGQASAALSSVQVQELRSGTWYAIGQLPAMTNGQKWTAAGTIVTAELSEGSHQVRAVAISPNGAVVGSTATSTLYVVHNAPAVTGVAATVSGSSVQVSWTAMAGATYNVYRATGNGGFAPAMTGISGGAFCDTALAGGQATGYVVTQTDVYGNESAFSNAQWVSTPMAWNTAVPDLTILTPNATERPDQAIIDLAAQVSAAGGLASLGFYYAPAGGGAWTSIPNVLPINPSTPSSPGGPSLGTSGGLGWTTTLNSTAVAAGKYSFRVVATDLLGRTAEKLDSFVVGSAGARGPPTAGFALNVNPTSTGILLTWTGITGDSFQVRRSIGASTSYAVLATTAASSFVDTAVIPGSTYQYQVVRLSPAIAYTAVLAAKAISPFNAGGKATSSDGSVAVGLGAASTDQLAVGITQNTAPPAIGPNMTAGGAVYDINASSYGSGAAVHQLDQPATVSFAIPAGATQAQAQGLSVFHWDASTGSWVREPTTLDWPNRRLIATVTHFSTFTIGATSVTLAYDQAGSVIAIGPSTTAGHLTVTSSTDSTQDFAIPTASFELDGTGAGQTVTVSGVLNLGAATFTIKLTDSQTDTGSAAIKTGHATINLTGATITAGAIDIEASATSADSNTGDHSVSLAFIGAPTLDNIINGTFLTPQNATVNVTDTSLTSSGDVTLKATGTSTITNTIAPMAGTDSSKDAALAVSVVDSTTTVNVSGNSSISAPSGALSLAAFDTNTVKTTGDASSATSGAGIAIAVVVTSTKAYIDAGGGNSISAKSITIAADTKNDVETKAIASSKGATGNAATFDPTSAVDTGTNTITIPAVTHGDGSALANGDKVVYSAGGGTAIGGLTDGSTYFVHLNTDGTHVQLDSDQTDAKSSTPSSIIPLTSVGAGTTHSLTLDDANTMTKTPANKDGNAKTSQGSLTFAGALAFHYVGDTTEAYVNPASGSLSVGATDSSGSGVKVHAASANTDPVTADGSTVKSKDSSDGVAIAIGVDIADIHTHAYLGGSLSFTAPAVMVEAPLTITGDSSASKDTFATSATSGLGDSKKLGIAGALTVNVINLDRSALVKDGASIDAPSAKFSVTAASDSTSSAIATPAKQVFDPKATGVISGNTINLPYKISGTLTTGDPLIYSNGDGTSIGGLTDGGLYYAVSPTCTATTCSLQLDPNKADVGTDTTPGPRTKIVTLDASKADGTEHSIYRDDSASVTFDPTASGVVDTSTNQITLPSPLTHGDGSALANGDKLDYSSGGGTNKVIGGLKDGDSYYAVVIDSTHIKLDTDQTDAQKTSGWSKIVSLSAGATGTNHSLAINDAGPDTGIGASVSVNVVNDNTTASLGANSTITNSGDLTLSSTAADAMTTTAKQGSKGNTAITPAVAVAVSNVTTLANVNSSSTTLGVSGKLAASATQTATTTATAAGDANGKSTAIGVAIALNWSTHKVQSTTFRNLNATGDISFTANGQSSNTSSAKASSSGAPDTSSDTSGKDVNGKADGELKSGNDTAGANGANKAGNKSSDSTTPKAGTSDSSGISVAAAIDFNIVNSTSDASLPGGLTVFSGGNVTFGSSANTDASATADGSASTSGDSSTIGVAVAFNVAQIENHADLGAGSTVTGNDVKFGATMTPVGSGTPNKSHDVSASATSGSGGGGSIGVAGSVALNVVIIHTTSVVASTAAIHAGNASGGDVAFTGESTSTSPVIAKPETQTFDPQSAIGSDNKTITLPAELKHKDGSALKSGDAVVYSAGGGTAIGCSGTASDTCGLKDGNTYYAIVISPGNIQLDNDKADSMIASPTKVITLDKTKAKGTEHALFLDDSTSVNF
ncbi:MAG TPA: hypothetical protein VGG90_03820, partial [Candidatus Dormibacteraeota bacterium]